MADTTGIEVSALILSSRLKKIKASASIAAKARAVQLKESGRKIIDLTVGEPDFKTPTHIIQAGVEAFEQGFTLYTASPGISELRAAIVNKFKRENNLDYSLAQVVVGSGAKQIIYNAMTATLNPGDEVIVPAPYWVSYPEMVILNEGIPVVVTCPAESGFKLTPELLESSITFKTRWVILNSPNNPTGAVYTREELAALGEVLLRHPHVWVLSDELYEHFIYEKEQHYSILNTTPKLAERTLVVNGVSKTYAMTGLRIGYAAGPVGIIGAISLLISQSITCANSIAQKAATVALLGEQECVTTACDMYEVRRDLMIEGLNKVSGITFVNPQGAFYVLISVEGLLGHKTAAGKILNSDQAIALYLIDEVGVVTVDGSSYGQPGYLRLSFATTAETIIQGCAAITTAFSRLSN